MMATVLVRIMVEACAALAALIICPVEWMIDGPSKAIATLIVLYMISAFAAPTKEDKALFAEFQKQRLAR